MLNILGMGSAYPETRITGSELSKITGVAASEATGSFYSVLPLEHLLETGNIGTVAHRAKALQQPSDLAVKAAHQAIERAGITLEDIGLVLGDSATPVETTPSEAQRTANRLGLKVPAYDIVSPTCAMTQTLSSLLNWIEEGEPEYILCITANTPTVHIDYRSNEVPPIFGDGAAAMVVSFSHKGRLAVQSAEMVCDGKHADLFVVDVLSPLKFSSRFEDLVVLPHVSRSLSELESDGHELKNTRIAVPAFPGVATLCESRGTAGNWISQFRDRGNLLGSSLMAAVADSWGIFRAGEKIVALPVGAGCGLGYMALEVRE